MEKNRKNTGLKRVPDDIKKELHSKPYPGQDEKPQVQESEPSFLTALKRANKSHTYEIHQAGAMPERKVPETKPAPQPVPEVKPQPQMQSKPGPQPAQAEKPVSKPDSLSRRAHKEGSSAPKPDAVQKAAIKPQQASVQKESPAASQPVSTAPVQSKPQPKQKPVQNVSAKPEVPVQPQPAVKPRQTSVPKSAAKPQPVQPAPAPKPVSVPKSSQVVGTTRKGAPITLMPAGAPIERLPRKMMAAASSDGEPSKPAKSPVSKEVLKQSFFEGEQSRKILERQAARKEAAAKSQTAGKPVLTRTKQTETNENVKSVPVKESVQPAVKKAVPVIEDTVSKANESEAKPAAQKPKTAAPAAAAAEKPKSLQGVKDIPVQKDQTEQPEPEQNQQPVNLWEMSLEIPVFAANDNEQSYLFKEPLGATEAFNAEQFILSALSSDMMEPAHPADMPASSLQSAVIPEMDLEEALLDQPVSKKEKHKGHPAKEAEKKHKEKASKADEPVQAKKKKGKEPKSSFKHKVRNIALFVVAACALLGVAFRGVFIPDQNNGQNQEPEDPKNPADPQNAQDAEVQNEALTDQPEPDAQAQLMDMELNPRLSCSGSMNGYQMEMEFVLPDDGDIVTRMMVTYILGADITGVANPESLSDYQKEQLAEHVRTNFNAAPENSQVFFYSDEISIVIDLQDSAIASFLGMPEDYQLSLDDARTMMEQYESLLCEG